MPQIANPEYRQWRILLIYNLYRVVSVFLLLGIYFYSLLPFGNFYLFFSILVFYFFCSLVFLCMGQYQWLRIDSQVFISGTVDILALTSMFFCLGSFGLGKGILLNVTIAALSILTPGRLAIFFASFASFLLLCANAFQFFIYNQRDLSDFYDSGIYGAGFFATALTAWYLSNWVRQSERIARYRSDELIGMQRINEFIVARLHSGIIYVDEDKKIKQINSAARQYFNIDKNISPVSLQHVSAALAKKFDMFLVSNKKHERMTQVILDDPYLKIHFFSTEVANSPAVLIILEDMTYISQQAQQLKLAALGRFSASIAHELRNPLGAIAHAAQLMGDEGSLSAEDAHLKQLIINNCDRMNGVIKNVLQLSRREQSKPELTELSSFLEHFKGHFSHNSQCSIIIKLPKKKCSIIFDKSQLEQILVALCENAIRHGQDETGKANIVIAVKSSAHKISISVTDSGFGIPLEYRDNIFEPFFTTLRHGTGMGLFIAKDLCEMNQARLSLMNTVKGCGFSITQNPLNELLL